MKVLNLFKKNNHGLSLVELVCAIAIMSVIFAGIAGSVVVSTNYYSKGANDIALQQSAQVLTNFLTNLIVDAKKVESNDACTELYITDTHDEVYTLKYEDKTLYLSTDSRGSGVLSDNLEKFTFIDNFDKNRKIKSVTFKFTLTHDKRHFKSSFTATSRNGETETKDGAVIVLTKPVVLAEPNETIEVGYNVYVYGKVYDKTLEGADGEWHDITHEGKNCDSQYKITGEKIIIKVGAKESCSTILLPVSTNAKYTEDGKSYSYDNKTQMVLVRRVNSINLTSKISQAAGSTGEVYTATANFGELDVYNGDYNLAYETLADWYCPYDVSLAYVSIKQEDGTELISASNPYTKYFDFEFIRMDKDKNILPDDAVMTKDDMYGIKVTVKKDGTSDIQLPYGSVIAFVFQADHSIGANGKTGAQSNRTGLKYYEPSGTSQGVYARWEISIKRPLSMEESGFRRGRECYLNEFINAMYFPSGNNTTGAIRFREVNSDGTYGAWSTFIMLEPAGANYKFPKDVTQFMFKPNKAYEIEMVPVQFSSSIGGTGQPTGAIKSPNYYALLDSWGVSYSGTADPETIYSCGNRIVVDACQLVDLKESGSVIDNNNGGTGNSTFRYSCSGVTSFETSVQDQQRINTDITGSQSDGLAFKVIGPMSKSNGDGTYTKITYSGNIGMEYNVYQNVPETGFCRINDLTYKMDFYPLDASYDDKLPTGYYTVTIN